jgi:AcrR family transcriptional regulator
VRAGLELFTARGFAGTTIGRVADVAGVSQKTVEAIYGTKAALLEAAVALAIRGDLAPVPMSDRSAVRRIEDAPDAATMLALHAAHLRTVNGRSAAIAWTVEQAAATDPAVARLWEQMNGNRRYAVDWATSTLLRKPGRRRGLHRNDVKTWFWVALDWGTYRTLTQHAGLSPEQFERWLKAYYRNTFLP